MRHVSIQTADLRFLDDLTPQQLILFCSVSEHQYWPHNSGITGKSALARTVAHLWNLPTVEFAFTGWRKKLQTTTAPATPSGVSKTMRCQRGIAWSSSAQLAPCAALDRQEAREARYQTSCHGSGCNGRKRPRDAFSPHVRGSSAPVCIQ